MIHIRMRTKRSYGSNAAGMVKFGAGIANPKSETFCGAACTDHDLNYRTGTSKWAGSDADVCPTCRRYAMNVKAARAANRRK